MVKLTGENKLYTAVFISGRGSNLNSIINYSFKKKSKIIIKLIVTDNHRAKGLRFSKKYNIKKLVINYKNKKKAEIKILNMLNKNKIKFICLAGFMKILSKFFLKHYKYPIINIHPSLLPQYKGLNTHERVIKNNEKFTGCTVHIVNQKLDSGKIILRKKIKVMKKDTPISLEKRLLKYENKLYPKAIDKFCFNL